MDHPLLNAFLIMLWFFLWVMWVFLLVRIFFDLFRSGDLSGWAKAAWVLVLLILPLAGVLAYLVIRGRSMVERDRAVARRSEEEVRSYVRETARGEGTADGLAKLADLKDRGAITQDEYDQAKTQLLTSAGKR
jgi:hypothetical protein